MELNAEQKRRIEENRIKALQLRAQKNNVPNNNKIINNTNNTNPSLQNKTSNEPSSKSSASFYCNSKFKNSHNATEKMTSVNLSKNQTQLKNISSLINKTSSSLLNNTVSNYSINNNNNQTTTKSTNNNKSGYNNNNNSYNYNVKNKLENNNNNQLQSNKLLGEKTKVKLVLISKERFVAEAFYFGPLIELFKTATTKQYDTQTRQWSFLLHEYQWLKKEISTKLKDFVTLEDLPTIVLKVFDKQIKLKKNKNNKSNNNNNTNTNDDNNNNNNNDDEDDDDDNNSTILSLSNVDRKLVTTLLPFQREGIEFAIKNKGRLLIADDMGLGKTLQAICIARYYSNEWPLLILTPSSVRFSWKQQLLNWLPDTLTNDDDVKVVVKATDDCSTATVVVIGYDLLSRCQQKILDRRFKVVIADESHCLKNCKAVRTKNALPILKAAKRMILLSGTPALSRPVELFSQLSAVDSKVFTNFHEYGVRYCNGREQPWGWDFSGSSNLGELRIVMEEKFIIRRLKKDVLKQLPSKLRTMVILDPTTVKVDKVMMRSHVVVEKTKCQERKALLEYFHQTGEAKTNAICNYILDLLDSSRKFILFAHHQGVLDAVEQSVKSKSFEYIRIDGRTNPEQRNYFCEKFQNNPDVKIAILSIMAANAGINLSSANLVVFGELFWNPGILVQAEDRAHRIGQIDSVNVQYLLARNTSDDFIWNMVQQKLELLGKAGLSGDNFSESETKYAVDSKQKILDSYFSSDSHNSSNNANNNTNNNVDDLFDVSDDLLLADLSAIDFHTNDGNNNNDDDNKNDIASGIKCNNNNNNDDDDDNLNLVNCYGGFFDDGGGLIGDDGVIGDDDGGGLIDDDDDGGGLIDDDDDGGGLIGDDDGGLIDDDDDDGGLIDDDDGGDEFRVKKPKME